VKQNNENLDLGFHGKRERPLEDSLVDSVNAIVEPQKKQNGQPKQDLAGATLDLINLLPKEKSVPQRVLEPQKNSKPEGRQMQRKESPSSKASFPDNKSDKTKSDDVSHLPYNAVTPQQQKMNSSTGKRINYHRLAQGQLLFNVSATAESNVLQDLFVFMHIPKCSGSSFKKYLCEITEGYEDIHWFNSCKEWQSFNAPGCGPADWGGTHCSYHELQDCLATNRAKFFDNSNPYKRKVKQGEKPLFITVLRDPVERVISEYFWWKDFKDCKRLHEWGECLCQAGRKGLDAWIESPCNLGHNRQTRFFTMEGEVAPGNKNFNLLNRKSEPQWECSSFFAIYAEDYWTKRYGKGFQQGLVDIMNNDNTLAEAALETIESKFWFIGIQEQYEESLKAFSSLTGNLLNTKVQQAVMKSDKSHQAHSGGQKKENCYCPTKGKNKAEKQTRYKCI